jgi:hypothetical protein
MIYANERRKKNKQEPISEITSNSNVYERD